MSVYLRGVVYLQMDMVSYQTYFLLNFQLVRICETHR